MRQRADRRVRQGGEGPRGPLGLGSIGRMSLVGVSLLSLWSVLGCKDLSGTPPLPAGTVSPGSVHSIQGAATLAFTAQVAFQQAFATFIPVAGELTDELQANGRDMAINAAGAEALSYTDARVDARLLDQSTVWNDPGIQGQPSSNTVYTNVQYFRGLAEEAIGDLVTYAPDTLKATRGQLYALLGYADIMLADLFCSGVPLSTLDFRGDYTYQPGSTTQAVYSQAVALFDTALMLAADSAPIVNLARVGQGRAYLALGDYTHAGAAVSSVPNTFQAIDSLLTCGGTGNTCPKTTATSTTLPLFQFAASVTVSDREGGTGLPYVSSGDPRTADTVIGLSTGKTFSQYFPKKYAIAGISAITLASGVEAQLITAEADLNASNASGAFAILNALRQANATTTGLPPLHDPMTFGAELDTLFTERAAWLFADGHRQGDMRRLMRNYVNGQGVSVVANQYPSGPYPELGFYGNSIDTPIPETELVNPYFTGCLSRD